MTIEFTPIGYVTEVLSHDAESKHTVNMRERIQILPEYREARKWLRSHSAELMSRNPAK